RRAFPQKGQHSNTTAAVSNLLTCLANVSRIPRMIVGHGMHGIIITGTGDVAPNFDAFISLRNISDWEPELKRLRGKTSELIFFSCDTGGEKKGPALLQKVADTINATVSAFTGLIFI